MKPEARDPARWSVRPPEATPLGEDLSARFRNAQPLATPGDTRLRAIYQAVVARRRRPGAERRLRWAALAGVLVSANVAALAATGVLPWPAPSPQTVVVPAGGTVEMARRRKWRVKLRGPARLDIEGGRAARMALAHGWAQISAERDDVHLRAGEMDVTLSPGATADVEPARITALAGRIELRARAGAPAVRLGAGERWPAPAAVLPPPPPARRELPGASEVPVRGASPAVGEVAVARKHVVKAEPPHPVPRGRGRGDLGGVSVQEAAPVPATEPPPVAPGPVPVPPVGAGVPVPVPRSPTAALREAIRALRGERDPGRALAALDRDGATLASGALAAEAALVRMEALLALGRRGEVLQLLDAVSLERVYPRRRDLRVLRGELRAAAGRWREAAADFQAALVVSAGDDLHQRALHGYASALARTGDPAAGAAFRDYLRRFPGGRFAGEARRALGPAPAP